jgi:hypothetical protein
MKPLTRQFFLASSYIIPLRHKYFPRHPVLEQPLPVFFTMPGTKFPIQNKTTGNITVLYCLYYACTVYPSLNW